MFRPAEQPIVRDPMIMHRLAEDITLRVWYHRPDDTWVSREELFRAGDWVAPSALIDKQAPIADRK